MKEQLLHILDQSVCLSRRQMRDYLSGSMEREEQHAVELHLISCPLCGMAMDGFETNSPEAVAGLNELNSRFLKAHFDTLVPQIHLNSMAPASAMPSTRAQRQSQRQPVWKHAAVITLLLGVFAVAWYYEFGRTRSNYTSPPTQVAEPGDPIPQPEPVQASVPAVPAKSNSKPRIHPDDEALIQEAKAMNAREPVHLTDDEELTRIFDESTAKNAVATEQATGVYSGQSGTAGQTGVKQDSPALRTNDEAAEPAGAN